MVIAIISLFCYDITVSLTLKEKNYTYKDYLEWPDDERWEIIDGEAYNMTPAPSIPHQMIAGKFYHILMNRLEGKPCVPFIAPTDVVLSEHDVVQPDILVVCEKNKITKANIQGAPNLIIEVLSPFTSLKDIRSKKACYEKFGVKEYIIVHPADKYVERFYLQDDGTYSKGDIFSPEETLSFFSLKDVDIPLSEVFSGIDLASHNIQKKNVIRKGVDA